MQDRRSLCGGDNCVKRPESRPINLTQRPRPAIFHLRQNQYYWHLLASGNPGNPTSNPILANPGNPGNPGILALTRPYPYFVPHCSLDLVEILYEVVIHAQLFAS